MLDLAQYTRVEDMSDSFLTDLETLILEYSNPIIESEGIILVGSYCFNLEDHVPDDLDVVLHVNPSVKEIKFPSAEGIGYDTINEFAYVTPHLDGRINKKLQITPCNTDYWKSIHTNFNPPYFDLLTRVWHNKEAGDVFPYTWSSAKKEWVLR